MRKSYLLLAGASAVLLAACSGDKKVAMNDDLMKDLELASSNDGITLASAGNAGTQVVSAIERTTPPSRQQTPSTRVRRHRAAPKAPPQVVRADWPRLSSLGFTFHHVQCFLRAAKSALICSCSL